jgi:hypothetical protein
MSTFLLLFSVSKCCKYFVYSTYSYLVIRLFLIALYHIVVYAQTAQTSTSLYTLTQFVLIYAVKLTTCSQRVRRD